MYNVLFGTVADLQICDLLYILHEEDTKDTFWFVSQTLTVKSFDNVNGY